MKHVYTGKIYSDALKREKKNIFTHLLHGSGSLTAQTVSVVFLHLQYVAVHKHWYFKHQLILRHARMLKNVKKHSL